MEKKFAKYTIIELKNILDKYEYKAFHIHHTFIPCHSDFDGENYQELQKNMKDFHMNDLGWDDIGQHISLFPDGIILKGRDFGKTPASIKGHNKGGFAMEMIGNFDIGNDIFEGKQKEIAIELTMYFIKKNIKIIFHNEFSEKTCPGTSINKEEFLDEVRRKYND